MPKRIRLLLLVLMVVVALAAGCQPAPDLNRPWHTATPEFAETQVSQAAAPTAAPTAEKQAAAGSTMALTIAGAEDNPPFMYADANGNPTGLYPVLLRAVFERMGYDITIQTFPWTRALATAENGEMPLAGIYKNEERLKIFDYSDAIYPNEILVYVQKGKAFEFAGPDDLAGKTVGMMTGWTYGDAFEKAKAGGVFQTEEVLSDSDNLQKLVLGRLDCVLAERTIAEQVIREQGYADQVEALPAPMVVFDAYMVFAKSTNQTALLETFNAAMAEMKADGSYDALVQEWKAQE